MTPKQTARLYELRQKIKAPAYKFKDITQDEKQELKKLSNLFRQEQEDQLGRDNITWLTEVMYRHDPAFLAKMGVPRDEYENEARLVLAHALDYPPENVEQLANDIKEIFQRQFNTNTAITTDDISVYMGIANELIKSKFFNEE